MFVNILILIVFILLTVGAGWLTWRAVRAKKLWLKIVGGIGAGLLTLLLAFLSFTGLKGVMSSYFPGTPDAPDLTVAGTPDQIARGEYLVDLSCVGCHSAVGADGNPTGQLPLSGGWNFSQSEGFGIMGDLVAENLTPGGKLAAYSDGELFRVLRHSVNQDGHKLGYMEFSPFKELSDEDTQAIIAYLRSLPAVTQTVETGDNLNFIGMLIYGSGMFPASVPGAETVTAPPPGITAEYGKYVATYGECRGCHGPDMMGVAATPLSPAVPNPRPSVVTWTLDQFFETMRSGIKPSGAAFSELMPYQNAAKMTDADLEALYLYLIDY